MSKPRGFAAWWRWALCIGAPLAFALMPVGAAVGIVSYLATSERLIQVDGVIRSVERGWDSITTPISSSRIRVLTVSYTYDYAGISFEDTRIELGCYSNCPEETVIELFADRQQSLAPGISAKIWIDSENPRESFLFKADGFRIMREIGLTALFLLGAVLAFFVLRHLVFGEEQNDA